MERVRWITPSKAQKYNSSSTNSPMLHVTPIKQAGIRSKHTAYQNNAGCLTILPSHITPPSGLTVIRKNPFEADLMRRLHLSTISPTLFTKISNSSQQSPKFTWSIDELANIQPAKIEELLVQQFQSPDPQVELKAQEDINQFFKKNPIVPSPWDIKEKNNKTNIDMDTPPSRPLDNLNLTKELSKLKKDTWSQTVLSLPIDLPPDVENALKSFLTFTQEQDIDNDDANSSNNSSLRRKLFFNHDECTDNDKDNDNDNESFVSFTSVEMNGSMALCCSPPQSGMFIYGSPLKGSLQTRWQNEESENLSPSDMSPIHKNEDNMLYKKVKHCYLPINCSFNCTMNMSIDDIDVEQSQHLKKNLSGTSCDTNDIKCDTENNHKLTIVNKTNFCNGANTSTLSRCVNTVDNIIHSDVLFSDEGYDAISLENKVGKSCSAYENYNQNNTMITIFEPQNISNSVQDTGYQTYSMNSTMQTVDSYNNTSINHKIQSNEQIVTFNDAQLSWKENMRNVFSSTPSKCDQEK